MVSLIGSWIPNDSNSYSSIQYVECQYRECCHSLTGFYRYPRIHKCGTYGIRVKLAPATQDIAHIPTLKGGELLLNNFDENGSKENAKWNI
jgi:hypothetical protein